MISMVSSQLNAHLGQGQWFLLTAESLGISKWFKQPTEERDSARWDPHAPRGYEYDPQLMMLEMGEKEANLPPPTALFLPCCELPSAVTELNKTHTWFIFRLAPRPLCSPLLPIPSLLN